MRSYFLLFRGSDRLNDYINHLAILTLVLKNMVQGNVPKRSELVRKSKQI